MREGTEPDGSTSQPQQISYPRDVPAPLFGEGVDFDLHDEVRMYRELLRSMPIAVYFKDVDTNFVDVNTFHAEAMGRPRNELIGLSDQDIYPETEAELYYGADRRVIDEGATIDGLIENHSGFQGTVFQNATSKFPVRNASGDIVGMMGFAIDVASSSGALEKLKESELRYALAMRATSEGIWDYDVAADSSSISPRAAQLLNLPITADSIPTRVVANILDPDDFAMLRSGLVALVRERQETFECVITITTTGRPRWLRLRFASFTENGRVTRVIGAMADITVERKRLDQLEHNAYHDALTGLGNRRALARSLSAYLSDCQSPTGEAASDLSLMSIDLDSFKVINDSLGHQAGDKMLCAIADRLRALTATTRGRCTVARMGGDEFAFAIAGIEPLLVEDLANSLLENIGRSTILSGVEIYPSTSIGLVHATDQTEATDMLRDGDIALYKAKASGKGRVVLFDETMREEAQNELNAQMRIRRAVDKRNFSLVYQPILRSGTRHVAGFEALLRLDSDDGETILPAKFLDYLEKSDLIVEVGRWVLDQALGDLAKWREQFPENPSLAVAVNVSRRQFSDPDLFTAIGDLLDKHAIPPESLVLEITETAAFSDDVDLDVLAEFRRNGGSVAMDDFGTGYSSLFALNELPVDVLKLDRSFTARINSESIDPVLQATFDFVRSLDLILVTEGVEEEHQAAWVESQGSDLLQGYLFARPMRFDAAVNYLTEQRRARDSAPPIDRAA